MSECDAVLEALFLGGALDATAARHVQACARCRESVPLAERLARSLAADAVEPPPLLAERVRHAAAPLLAARARAEARRVLARAVGVALLPLPLVVLLDVYLVHAAYALMRVILPDALSLYLIYNYVALLALLLALTYGAIPLLSERQLRRQREESHA